MSRVNNAQNGVFESTTTDGVVDHETLQARAVVRQLPYAIKK